MSASKITLCAKQLRWWLVIKFRPRIFHSRIRTSGLTHFARRDHRHSMYQLPSFHPDTSSYQILSRLTFATAPLALSFTLISHPAPSVSSHCAQHLAPRIASYARSLKRLVLTYNALHATTSSSLYSVLEGRLIAFVRASNRTALLRWKASLI
jgi:hypothetical protein